jgi:hypothetical protein
MLRGVPYFFMIRLRSFSAAALSRFAVATASKGDCHIAWGKREASAAQEFSGCCDGGPPCVHRHSAKLVVRLG